MKSVVFCQRQCVLLKDSRSLLWCVVCSQGFDCVVNSKRFLRIGCSSW